MAARRKFFHEISRCCGTVLLALATCVAAASPTFAAEPEGGKRKDTAHDRRVMGVDFHPEGKLIASCGMDGRTRVWDVETGALRFDLDKHAKAAARVRFSPDGALVASLGSQDPIPPVGGELGVRVWQTETGRKLYELSLSEMGGVDLAFSADGRSLATTGHFRNRWWNHDVFCWTLETKRCDTILSREEPRLFGGYRVALLPDGKHAVTVTNYQQTERGKSESIPNSFKRMPSESRCEVAFWNLETKSVAKSEWLTVMIHAGSLRVFVHRTSAP